MEIPVELQKIPFLEFRLGENYQDFLDWYEIAVEPDEWLDSGDQDPSDEEQEPHRETEECLKLAAVLRAEKDPSKVKVAIERLVKKYEDTTAKRTRLTGSLTEELWFQHGPLCHAQAVVTAVKIYPRVRAYRQELFNDPGAPFRTAQALLEWVEKNIPEVEGDAVLFPDLPATLSMSGRANNRSASTRYPVSSRSLPGKALGHARILNRSTIWDDPSDRACPHNLLFLLTDIFPVTPSARVRYSYNSKHNRWFYEVAFDNRTRQSELAQIFKITQGFLNELHQKDPRRGLPDIRQPENYRLIDFVLEHQILGHTWRDIHRAWERHAKVTPRPGTGSFKTPESMQRKFFSLKAKLERFMDLSAKKTVVLQKGLQSSESNEPDLRSLPKNPKSETVVEGYRGRVVPDEHVEIQVEGGKPKTPNILFRKLGCPRWKLEEFCEVEG